MKVCKDEILVKLELIVTYCLIINILNFFAYCLIQNEALFLDLDLLVEDLRNSFEFIVYVDLIEYVVECLKKFEKDDHLVH